MTITTQLVNTANVIIKTQNSTGTNTSSIAIAVDYTEVFDLINTSLQTIATNSTLVVTKLTEMNQTLNEIKTDIDTLTQRGSSDSLGIATRSSESNTSRALVSIALKDSGKTAEFDAAMKAL